MAWFGGGLSKLTDEISNLGNLTREVLSDTLTDPNEDVSEVAEEALQRRPSDVPQLEEKVKRQEDVIQTLQMENELLMKKLNDQLLSLDQASPRSTLGRSFQSAADTWGEFDDDDEELADRRRRRASGTPTGGSGIFPGGDFEFDDDKENTQDELTTLKQKIEALEQENEDLLRETAEIPDLRSRIKQLNNENNMLIKSTDKFEREVESSKKLLDGQQESIVRLESQVSHLQTEVSNQNATIAELTAENAQLREAVDSQQDENSNLSTGIEQLDMQHSRDLQDLMDSKRDADRRVVTLTEQVTALQAALDAAQAPQPAQAPTPRTDNSIQTEPDLPLPLPLEQCHNGSDNSDELSEAYDMLQNEYDDLKAKFEEAVKRAKPETEPEESISNQTEASTTSSAPRNEFELMPNMDDYTEKIRTLNEEVSQLKTKENELHTRIEELEDKLQQKEDDEKSSSYNLEEKSIEISQLTEHNRFLQQEMDSLKEKQRDLMEIGHKTDDDKTTEKLEQKEEVIEQLNTELESVQTRLSEKESELESVQKTLCEKEVTINENLSLKDKLIEKLKTDLEDLKKSLHEKEREIENMGMSDELKEVIQDQEKIIEKLEADQAVIETKEAEAREKLVEQEKLVEKLTAKLNEVEEKLKQKEQEPDSWNENDNWGSSSNEELGTLRKENEEIKEKLAKQEDSIARLKTHSESLQKQLIEKEMEIEEWGNNDNWGAGDNDDKLKEENAGLNKTVLELQTQLQSVQEALKSAEESVKKKDLEDWGQSDDWGADNSELSTMRAKCSEQEKTIVELKQALAEKENELADWGENSNWGAASGGELDTLREESGRLNEKLSEQKNIISKLKSQLEAAQASSSAQPADQDRDSRIELLSRENEGLRTRVEQLGLVIENNYVQDADPSNLQDNAAQLVAEKEKLDEEVNVLSQENKELKKKLEQAVEKQKGLEEEIQQLEEDAVTLREQLEYKDQVDDSIEITLRNEIQEIRAQLQAATTLVAAAQAEKLSLDREFKELKEKYDQASEKLKAIPTTDTVDVDTLMRNLQSKEEEMCRLLDEKNTLDNIKVEKENLEVQLDHLNTTYQDKINTLIQANNDFEEKIGEQNNLQHNKNNEISDLTKRISLFEENNAFLQRTIVDLERNLDEKIKEMDEKEINFNENIEINNHKIQALTQENEKLKEQLVSLTESQQLVKQEQAQLAAAQVDETVINENEQLKRDLESVKQEAGLTIENLHNQIAHKDVEINNKVAEMNASLEKCKQYENKCNELEATLSAKMTDFSTKEQLNRSQMEELRTMLEAVQVENVSIKEMNEELFSQKNSFAENLKQEDQKVVDKYKQQIQELDAKLAEEIQSKTLAVQSLELQVKEMQDRLNNYAHVENELGQYRNQVLHLEQTQTQLMTERTQWIHEFELKNNALSDLQKQLNEYNSKMTQSNQVDQELGAVKAQIQELELTKQELLRQVNEQSISSNFLRNELEALQDQFNQTKTNNERLEQEKNTLMETRAALEAKLKEFTEKENQYRAQFTQFEQTEHKLNEELARKDETIATLSASQEQGKSVASIEEIIKEKDNTLAEMMKTCEAKDLKLTELQQTVDKYVSEKYQFEKEALDLRNTLTEYENELQLVRATSEDLEYQLQERDKLVQELNQMKESFFVGDTKDSVRYSDEEHVKELRELQLMNESLHNEMYRSATEIENMKETICYLEQYNLQLRKSPQQSAEVALLSGQLEEQKRMYQELVKTVTTKHEESVRYHNEIQRLNGVLSAQLPRLSELGNQVNNLEQQLKATSEALATKERHLAETKEKLSVTQSQLEEVTQLMHSNERPEADGQAVQESVVQALHVAPVEASRERDELSQRVQSLQDEKAMLLTEINDLRLNQNNLYNENERLKQHLLHIEEENTVELVKAEDNIQKLSAQLREAEERVKSSATAYTSASVRSNQQVESLSHQVKSLSEHNNKLQEKLLTAEQLVEKHQASLTNLQIVLEQFQADKENEITQGLEFLQGELNNSYAKNNELCQTINSLQHQLAEARDNLSAAARLSDELHQKTLTIEQLNLKVEELLEELNKRDAKLKEVNNGGKVDKCLVTNMLCNFLTAPSRPARRQALQVLASVIDMSSGDRQRIGLEPSQAFNPNQSLSEAFVQFLENESSPRPNTQTSTPVSRRTSTTTSPLIFPETALPSLPQFPPMTPGSMLKDVLHSDS
uniref:Thyroid receptor-interacting protein 11 n=1 Tax=Cacopsylla melanoneura TaxID=428564 RepID=A0A8D8TFZ2_9HEMI